jgi:hypothetical protein
MIEELSFVIETNDFAKLISQMQRYGGRTPLVFAFAAMLSN